MGLRSYTVTSTQKAIVSLPFGAGIVLFDEHNNRLFAYNESAKLVWRALEEGASTAHTLADAYGICLTRAQRDADAIIDHWRGQGLVADSGAPEPEPELQVNFSPPLPAEGPASLRDYDIHGHCFRVLTTDSRISETLDGVLGPMRVARSYATTLITVTLVEDQLKLALNGEERLRSHETGEIIGAIFQTMLEVVHGTRDWLAIIHGAAVLSSNGALVLAGPSGSGKSTFGAYMTTLGFGYAADDMAAVLRDGRLAPWPVARRVKSGSWKALHDFFPELERAPVGKKGVIDLKFLASPASAWAEAPRKVQAILFPHYSDNAVTELMPLNPMQVLQSLLKDRLWLPNPLAAAGVRAFLAWLGEIQAFSVCYSDMREAGALVRTRFL